MDNDDNDSLVFNMDTFNKESFSVDEFLTENRNKMTLENMRVEMGIYLKNLRVRMINSLNEDCDKYFHLSKALIGIDKQLASLKPGLHSLCDSVSEAKNNLENTLGDLDSEIQSNKRIRQDKQSFYAIVRVQKSLDKLDGLLSDQRPDCDLIVLTRAVTEMNQLSFNMSKCSKILKPVHWEKHGFLSESLINKLNKGFETIVSSKSTCESEVKRFLELYTTLGRINCAEGICRTVIMAPAMKSILNESYLRSCNNGLIELYSHCSDFLQKDLNILLKATAEHNKECSKYGKFDLISKSFWPIFCDQVKNNLSCIFNLREPDIFIQNYKTTINEFLTFLNTLTIKQNESSPLYKADSWNDFRKNWNLSIYYQYRYQEIGFRAEDVMNNEIYEPCDSDIFELKVTKTVWDCIVSCLDSNIFIVELGHRFFKLILQLISRYYSWGENANRKSKTDIKDFGSRIKFLEDLESDLKAFYFKLNDIFSMFHQTLPKNILADVLEEQKKCIEEINFNSLINDLSKCQVQSVMDEAMSHVIRVTDVPRLFRHTNRDYPTEPCAYMKSIVSTLKALQNKKAKKQVLDHIVTQYVAYVNDVMKAIKKTEESLRKLKKIRDPNYKVNSDDDKIRCQLSLDVNFLLLTIGEMRLPEINEIELKLDALKQSLLSDKL